MREVFEDVELTYCSPGGRFKDITTEVEVTKEHIKIEGWPVHPEYSLSGRPFLSLIRYYAGKRVFHYQTNNIAIIKRLLPAFLVRQNNLEVNEAIVSALSKKVLK